MRLETYGDEGNDRVVFVLGWGNKPEFDNVQWLVDRLVEADYLVDVFEIPPHVSDYRAEWIEPVRSHVAEHAPVRSLSHSTGGLISRYLDAADLHSRVYLSPWWGFHEDLESPLTPIILRLPISTPFLPADFDKEELGELATEYQVEHTPSKMAPTFLREAKRGQRNMPPFDVDDAVFYSPTDPIVGTDAIEEQAPPANRVQYEGGHELFCSSSRDEHIDTVLAALEDGAAALDGA
jgi:hypothetical protein